MSRIIEWLVRVQVRWPIVPLVIVAIVTGLLGVRASQLTLHTEYEALLPRSAQSVRDLDKLKTRVTPTQTVLVLLEHEQRPVLHACRRKNRPRTSATRSVHFA